MLQMWPHYRVIPVPESEGMAVLQGIFPTAQADEMNFCLLSTDGVHGSSVTLEDLEQVPEEVGTCVTFLIVHPRLVCLRYGNARVNTPEDLAFLKRLRQSSWEAVAHIGYNG